MSAISGSEPGGRAGWRLGALSLTMLLPSLGTSIANVALPTMQGALGASFQEVQWVVLAYLLAMTALIVGAGRLGDLFGRSRLLLAGIAVFTLASVGCATAPSLRVLVMARGLQGLGAAIMMALAPAAVADSVPKDRIGRAMGLLGTVSAVGTALGPSLGGVLIAWAGWPAVFAVVAAAGVVTFGLAQRVLIRDREARREGTGFDLPGTLLLAIALTAYALGMTVADTVPGLSMGVLDGVALLALVAFVLVEKQSAAPLIRLQLLRDRNLNAGLVAIALVSAIVMATLVVGPFYLSAGLGLAPAATGLVMSIGPAVAALGGIPSGRLVDRLGARKAAAIGLSGVVAGSLLMTVLPGSGGAWGYAAALATMTAGYALFQAANTTAIVAGAAPDRRGVLSGLLGLGRNLGLITGAAGMGALYVFGSKHRLAFGLPDGSGGGLALTFAAAAGLALVSLTGLLWAARRG